MAHHHHHAAELGSSKSAKSVLAVCIALNLAFVVIEAAVGLSKDSLGLLSDAGHNLGDVFSLAISLLAVNMSARAATKHFTYGYKRSTILASLANAVILLIAVGAILIECVSKFRHPGAVSGAAVSWTAAAGIVVNGLTTLLLMSRQRGDLNMRGAFVHMMMDTLVSLGVVVSGVIIILTGWTVIDAVISLVIAVVIIISTWSLLRESLSLSLDGVPETIDIDRIEAGIRGVGGVVGLHHLHVWAISTTEIAATLHLVVSGADVMERVKDEVKGMMAREGVAHCTVECELPGETCHDRDCH